MLLVEIASAATKTLFGSKHLPANHLNLYENTCICEQM